MIDLYTAPQAADRDFEELRAEGKQLLSQRRFDRAVSVLFSALRGHAHVRDDDYRKAAAMLRDAYIGLGKLREAVTVCWYLGDQDTQKSLLDRLPLVERARTLISWGQAPWGASTKASFQAADALESAGKLVQAAIAFEQAGDWDRARALWSRLAPQLGATQSLYEAALAHFNLFRCSRKVNDLRSARAASIAAVHLLEEAADRYETAGRRERAFDCFRTLVAIGTETGVFEHVLEGYVNGLRILQEDHLRHYALKTFDEAINAAQAQGEHVAAATLAREMATFARKEQEAAVANQAALVEAELWREVSRQNLARNGPIAVSEHALLAAVLSLGEVGQYRTVGGVYAELGKLDLEASKKEHYARAMQRYQQAQNDRLDTAKVPDYGGNESAFPNVWHVDLVEWEHAGVASELCADVLLGSDAGYAESSRRRALLGRLVALAVEEGGEQPAALVQLCPFLAELQLYTVLSAVERLAVHSSARVREAAVRELRQFRFKRTFHSIRQGLSDPEPGVVQQAAAAIAFMKFNHAIEPLTRIYRESPVLTARLNAIQALAEIERVEAGEALLGVLTYGAADDRTAATAALKQSKRKAFLQVARQAKADLDPATRRAVEEIFEARKQPF
jgi:tetratricopeptide (TPR) repeat protein